MGSHPKTKVCDYLSLRGGPTRQSRQRSVGQFSVLYFSFACAVMGAFKLQLMAEDWSRQRVLQTLTMIVNSVLLGNRDGLRSEHSLQVLIDVHGPCEAENLKTYFAFVSGLESWSVTKFSFLENDDEGWQISFGSDVDRVLQILPTVFSHSYAKFRVSIKLEKNYSD